MRTNPRKLKIKIIIMMKTDRTIKHQKIHHTRTQSTKTKIDTTFGETYNQLELS